MPRRKKPPQSVLQDYHFPEYGITVRARSAKEAKWKLTAELRKRKQKSK